MSQLSTINITDARKEQDFLAKIGDTSICFSGGAIGADSCWGEAAEKVGHQVYHLSFDGHKISPNNGQIVRLSHDELILADSALKDANKVLKRNLPFKKPWIINLLRRNWYQIIDSDNVYAVGESEFDGNYLKISGGTAWACEMFIRKIWSMINKHSALIEFNHRIFFYDQNNKEIYTYHIDVNNLYSSSTGWRKDDYYLTIPSGKWTGIGTRKLNDSGRAFINELFS